MHRQIDRCRNQSSAKIINQTFFKYVSVSFPCTKISKKFESVKFPCEGALSFKKKRVSWQQLYLDRDDEKRFSDFEMRVLVLNGFLSLPFIHPSI